MPNERFYVIPTIDAEGVHGAQPFENFAIGEIGAEEDWGSFKIARIFREFGVTGTFFVDVYEHSLFGEAPVARLCEGLAKLGQDVQLHTHPSWRDDPRDHQALRDLKRQRSYMAQSHDFMAKLSVAQQVDVLGHGIDCLKKWIGIAPVIHRSGGYSINADTISALRQVGMTADSSMNVSHGNSRLTWSRNQIVEQDGILELPVTVARISAGVPGIPLYKRLIKTDINALEDRHLRQFCIQGARNDLVFLNYFMHSYSLLDYAPDFTNIRPSRRLEQQMRQFLGWAVEQPWIKVTDCKALLDVLRQPGFDRGGTDFVPEFKDTPLIMKKGFRKLTGQLAQTH
ncbi:MAG: hypothetical protein AB7E81_20830 [Hyphomicrobiaceae bacterium]